MLERLDDDARALAQRTKQDARERDQNSEEQKQALQRAQADLAAGKLDSVRARIPQLGDAGARDRIADEVEVRQRRSDELLDQASAALARGDLLTAVSHWHDACRRHGRTTRCDELAARLASLLETALLDWLRRGELERVRFAIGALGDLRAHQPGLERIARVQELVSQCAALLGASGFSQLRDQLIRLRASLPEAEWVAQAIIAAEEGHAAHARLLSSPLGTHLNLGAAAETLPHEPAAARPASTGHGVRLDRPILLLIDGTGSALLVPGDTIRVGRAAGRVPVEIGLPAELQSHHADLVRKGEDYFLVAHGPATVNRARASRVLLQNGDRIRLGDAARIDFHKPSARSETAVLKLSDSCRMAQDVSRVVILRDTCLIGPHATCHIETREGDAQIVLYDRAGELWARPVARDRRPAGEPRPIVEGSPSELGDIRLTAKYYAAAVGPVG